MQKSKFLFLIILFSIVGFAGAQRIDLEGQLIAKDEVEGLHVLNKSALKYTISEENGSFVIPARVSDTLIISGVKYQLKEIVITDSIINSDYLRVQLIENISALNEVVVGKIFTGSLESDIENLKVKPEINFYDLGIPGYTGKPLTQNERKLYDANGGSMVDLVAGAYGTGPSVNLNKLLNTISGRTKKLKAIVELDNREGCIQRLKRDYEAFLFEKDTLTQNLRAEYFLYCEEDARFLGLCNKKDEFALIEFLQAKLKLYLENRKLVIKD
ncbi:hypothetical protein [Winogradskyella wichelsiae]|uniref:hypothetical protein n=1 Tax=Winogradskyella wichelsiae TaxID=2697007 RepID=UPI003EFA6BDC